MRSKLANEKGSVRTPRRPIVEQSAVAAWSPPALLSDTLLPSTTLGLNTSKTLLALFGCPSVCGEINFFSVSERLAAAAAGQFPDSEFSESEMLAAGRRGSSTLPASLKGGGLLVG